MSSCTVDRNHHLRIPVYGVSASHKFRGTSFGLVIL